MAGGDPQDLAGCVAAIMSGTPGSLTAGGTTFNQAGQQVETTCGAAKGGASGVQSSWQSEAGDAFEGAVTKLVAEGRASAQLAQNSKKPLDTASKALTDAQASIQKLQTQAAAAQSAAAAAVPPTQADMTQFNAQAVKIFTTLKTAYQTAVSALTQTARQADGQGTQTAGGAAGDTAGGTNGAAAPGTEQKTDTNKPGGATSPGAATSTNPSTVSVNPPGAGTMPGGGPPSHALVPPPDPGVHTSALAIGAPDPTGGGMPASDLVMSTGGTDPTGGNGLLSLGRTTGAQDPSTVLTGYTGPMSPTLSVPTPSVAVPTAGPAMPGGAPMSPMFGMGMGMGDARSTLTSAGPQRSTRPGDATNTIEPEVAMRPPVSLGAPGGMSPYVGGMAESGGEEEERTTNLVGTEKWNDEQVPDNVLGRPGAL